MEIPQGFRLSPQQRRSWMLQRTSDNRSFAAFCAVRLDGDLDVDRWQQALRLTVQRHEILRTTFLRLFGMRVPVQCVGDQQQDALRYQVHDLQALDPEQRVDRLVSLIEEARSQTIDAEHDPVLCATHVVLQPARQYWLLTLPVLCADRRALGYLVEEICAAYAALRSGDSLPDVALQYADVAEILNQLVEEGSPSPEPGKTVDISTAGRLPFERLPHGSRMFRSARYTWRVSAGHMLRARSLAETENLELSSIFLACWSIVLWRLSGQTINAVGVIEDGRLYEELEQAIGLFETVRPISYELERELTFAEALRRCQQARDALSEQAVPGAWWEPPASEEAAPPTLSYTFGYTTAPDPIVLDDRCVCTIEDLYAIVEPFSAQLSIHEAHDDAHVTLSYNADLYGADDIARLGQAYNTVLGALLARPSARVSRHALVDEATREQILATFNATNRPLLREGLVDQLFQAQAERTPDRIALRYEAQKLTYHEVHAQSTQLARRLRRCGVRGEHLVAVYLDRSLAMIIAMLAVLKTGGAYVPIDPTYPPERVRLILEDTRASCLITHSSLTSHLLTAPEHMVCVDTDWPQIAQEPTVDLQHEYIPGTLAYVLYTSGSTGKPKGVMIEHDAITNLVQGLEESIYHRYEAPVNVALLASYVFDASVQQIFTALLLGHTLHIGPEEVRRDGKLLLRFYEQHRIDISDATPALLTVLMSGTGTGSADLPVKDFLVGGEALPPALVTQFYHTFGAARRLTNVYGPAECCVDTNAWTVDSPRVAGQTTIPIGPPMANRRAYVLDQDFNPVPIGVPGELYIAGMGLGRGYWNNPGLTAERFLPNPFEPLSRMYRTGDVCRWLADGSVDFLERADLQVQIRGFRIELEEVEAALRDHPAVKSAVLAARVRQTRPPAAARTCRRCFLTTNMPHVSLDSEGVCNVCRAYEHHSDRIAGYFRREAELVQLFERARGGMPRTYDCLFLYSGGKDSTYALHRLVELGLRVLAVTVDNGFLSSHTHTNIRNVCAALQVDLEVVKPRHINKIFVESLQSYSSVCDGCFRAVNAVGSRMAIEKGIPVVVTALSRGQIYTKLTNFLLRHEFDFERIERELLTFRKVHYATRDTIGMLIHDHDVPEDDTALDGLRFVDFFRYCDVTQEELLAYLQTHGVCWKMPPDTGFGSTDCLINEAGVHVHLQERGYHFYADQISWEVRIGHIPYKAAQAKLDERTDQQRVNGMLTQIGYQPLPAKASPAETYLCAYILAKTDISPDELRAALSRRLPDYMIPSAFVFCESFPVTVNGKIDRKALPEPDLAERQRRSPIVEPTTACERRLAAIWEETLGVERVGLHDSLFALGGHSLVAAQLMGRICEAFQIDLPIRLLFEHTTVGSLAQVIEQRLTDQIITQVTQLSAESVQYLLASEDSQ